MPLPIFLSGAAKPRFFLPSQLVSWSAQPLEPPRETEFSALPDISLTMERKESMFDCSKFTSLVAKMFVQERWEDMRVSVIPDQSQPSRKRLTTFSMPDLVCND